MRTGSLKGRSFSLSVTTNCHSADIRVAADFSLLYGCGCALRELARQGVGKTRASNIPEVRVGTRTWPSTMGYPVPPNVEEIRPRGCEWRFGTVPDKGVNCEAPSGHRR